MAFPIYPGVKSYNNIPTGYPVEVNASFNTLGDFRPRMFRIEINSERFVYRVKSVESIKANGNIISYFCYYEDNEQLRSILLRYEINTHSWSVN